MPSPEFSPKLDLSSAQEYRRGEANALRNARASGLGAEAREYRDVLHEDPLYQQTQTLAMQHRWEQLAQKIPEFSQEDWERAGRVFSGINNGLKAAIFIDIAQNTSPGMYMPTENIVDRFKNLFAGTQLLEAFGKNTKSQVIDYCQESLCDVGLLTAEYSLAGKPIGFGVTQEGIESGLPHALRLLAWENTMKESAYPILGPTNSGGETRAPANSARMLDYFFRDPYNVREVDLSDALRMGNSIIAIALKRFYYLGLVDYKAITSRTSEAQLEYVWDTNADIGQARQITGYKKLQEYVVAVIRQKGLANPAPRFSIKGIVQSLPEEFKKRQKEKSLRQNISSILSGLARDGLLQRVNNFKGAEKQSDISLAKKGRAFIFRIILPTLLERPAQPLPINFPQLARTSAELYYPHSKSSKKREKQNNIQKLVQTIIETNAPQAAQELATIVGLSVGSINKILRPHIKGSSEVILEVGSQPVVIERRKEKGVWYYSLKSPDNE